MSKKKHLHGSKGKGSLVRQMAFFYQRYPNGTWSGIPKPQPKKTARVAANNTDGKGGTDLQGPVSASHDTKETEDLQGGISK